MAAQTVGFQLCLANFAAPICVRRKILDVGIVAGHATRDPSDRPDGVVSGNSVGAGETPIRRRERIAVHGVIPVLVILARI